MSDITSANPPGPTADQKKVALEQYRNVLGQLQHENAMTWTRSGFLIVAQAAILTAFGRWVSVRVSFWDVVLMYALPMAGLFLTLLWGSLLKTSRWWTDHWHRTLLQLEPDAYGEVKVYRGAIGPTYPREYTWHSAAMNLCWVFRVLWWLLMMIASGLFWASFETPPAPATPPTVVVVIKGTQGEVQR
jgi:hypothetical protein